MLMDLMGRELEPAWLKAVVDAGERRRGGFRYTV